MKKLLSLILLIVICYSVSAQPFKAIREVNFKRAYIDSLIRVDYLAATSTGYSLVVYDSASKTFRQIPASTYSTGCGDSTGGGGTGSVTSVGISSPDLTVTGTNPIVSSGTFTLTLPTVNAHPGTFGNSHKIPVITANAKGLVTNLDSVDISIVDTTLFPAYIDSTTQAYQRILVAGRDGKISSDSMFLYNFAQNKVVINAKTSAKFGSAIKLYVNGGAVFNGIIAREGGKANQFLKADGSLDTNHYVKSVSVNGTTYRVDTTTGNVNLGTIASGGGSVTSVGLTSSDITIGGATSPITGSGTYTLTLPDINANVGTFNSLTVNAKGQVTGGATIPYLTANQTITLSGDISGSGTTAITTTLPNINPNVGTFNNFDVNAKGQITGARTIGYLTSFTETDPIYTSLGVSLAGQQTLTGVKTFPASTTSNPAFVVQSGSAYTGTTTGATWVNSNHIWTYLNGTATQLDNQVTAANAILNQTSLQSSANFNIDGTGGLGGNLTMTNYTPATISVGQNSPMLTLKGQGWASTPASSMTVESRMSVAPNTATTRPNATLTMDMYSNGLILNNAFTYTSSSNVLQSGNLYATSALYTGGGILYGGAPGGSGADISVNNSITIFQKGNLQLAPSIGKRVSDNGYKLYSMGEGRFIGGIHIDSLTTPAGLSAFTSGTAGSTTYKYRVVALLLNGQTSPASAEFTFTTGNATLTGTNFINLSWTQVAGAYQYRVYRTFSGGTPATIGLITTIPQAQNPGIIDNGLAGDGNNTFPTINSSANLSINTVSANSNLQVAGSVSFNYTAVTSAYTIGYTDYTIDCTSGTFTATLPTAVGIKGRTYVIKNSGAGAITVATTGGQTIDGASTYPLGTQFKYVTVQSNNANWIVSGNN